MGTFDRVWVPCPNCGKPTEFQSKSGPCTLADYTTDDCPPDVLKGLDGSATCEACGEGVFLSKPVNREAFIEKVVDELIDCARWGTDIAGRDVETWAIEYGLVEEHDGILRRKAT